jgi:hypothetical protein
MVAAGLVLAIMRNDLSSPVLAAALCLSILSLAESSPR